MTTDHVSNLPYDGQILHSLGEASDQSELRLGIRSLNRAVQSLVHNFDCANETILTLVGVACIYDDTVEGNLLLTVWNGFTQLYIVHLTPFFVGGVVVIWHLVVDYHF